MAAAFRLGGSRRQRRPAAGTDADPRRQQRTGAAEAQTSSLSPASCRLRLSVRPSRAEGGPVSRSAGAARGRHPVPRAGVCEGAQGAGLYMLPPPHTAYGFWASLWGKPQVFFSEGLCVLTSGAE